MAAWQVEFAIVPRRALAVNHGVPLVQLFDTDWWASAALPAGYTERLTAFVPSSPSSAPELQTWGAEEGNRIDVWSDNGRAVRMSARVDVRKLDAKFGAMLLQFARIADAVLVRRDGLVIEPQVGAFGAALRSSDAWRFSTDPSAAIQSIRESLSP